MDARHEYLQMRVDSRDLGLEQSVRERRQPPLGLPLERVRTPQVRVCVGPVDGDYHECSLWHVKLRDLFPIDGLYRLGEGQYSVLVSPM